MRLNLQSRGYMVGALTPSQRAKLTHLRESPANVLRGRAFFVVADDSEIGSAGAPKGSGTVHDLRRGSVLGEGAGMLHTSGGVLEVRAQIPLLLLELG